MFGTLGRGFQPTVAVMLSLTAALVLSAVAHGQAARDQDSDLLDDVRQREKVAAQKTETELRQVLREAQRLAASDPASAADMLTKVLAQLEQDTSLTETRRDSLKRMLKDRIRIAKAEAKQLTNDNKDRKRSPNRDTEDARTTTEQRKIQKSLKTIKSLQEDGMTDEARRESDDLSSRYPDNPATQASGRITLGAEQLARIKKLKKDRERSMAGVVRDVENSATPPAGDTEFPKDWKERTKGRTAGVQLTAKEKAILKALNSTVSVNFKNSKLEDALEYLQTATGQPILMEREALKGEDTPYDSPVTLNVKNVSLRTVLRRILADVGLTYVVKDETIHVTSAQRAKEMMVTRRYYVGDLLANMGAFPPVGGLGGIGGIGALPAAPGIPVLPPALGWAPILTPQAQNALVLNAQAVQNAEQFKLAVEQLREIIESSVDSQSWRSHGGEGTITFHQATMSFIVRQSAEVHALLGNGGGLK